MTSGSHKHKLCNQGMHATCLDRGEEALNPPVRESLACTYLLINASYASEEGSADGSHDDEDSAEA
jgi:hypothetical protein